MLTVEAARSRILDGIVALDIVEVPLADAAGAVVAADIEAPHPLPRFDNSAMDGYAVMRADVAGAAPGAPVTLHLAGEVRAGQGADQELAPGTCVRIMTGAMIPQGADAVVPVEVADEEAGAVRVREEPPPGGHVRPAGEDVVAGSVVVSAGTEIGAGELALLASLGVTPVRVHRPPRVGIVITGDELVPPDREPGPGQIRDSNGIALATLVGEAGGEPHLFEAVTDELEGVVATLRRAASESDLVVSAGGVSVGRYDFVREAVERLGRIDLWRVAMQPGKPVVSGHVTETPFLGLPGNPVSIHIGFEQFVRPVIRKQRGSRSLLRPVVRARLASGLSKRAGRLHFVRVKLAPEGAGFVATPSGPQGSHIQSSLVGCDGIARFAIEDTELLAGDEVDVEVWKLPGAGPST